VRVPASRYGFVSVEDFNAIDDFAADLQAAGRNLYPAMNALAKMLSYVALGAAQEMSAGPVDPLQTNREAAWKIPVRRITSHYYKGWKVRRMAPGWWQTYNDSREAFYIEYGINPRSARRPIRRPIRKFAFVKTLRFVDNSRAEQYVWEMVFGPLKSQRNMREVVGRGDLSFHPAHTGSRLYGVGG